MRTDLPPDDKRSLEYVLLIQTLKFLDGKTVCLFIPRGGSGGRASRIQAKGIIHHYVYEWAEGFAIGDGARVLLYKPDFISANLRTSDGVDSFAVDVRLADVEFSIGDPGSLATDEFDLSP